MTAPNPTPRRPDAPSGEELEMIFPTAAANDDAVIPFGPLTGPEPVLTIEFIGFTADESSRALASFPGGRRCALLRA